MKMYVKINISVESEKGNILNFNQYMKPDKMPQTVYVDIESLNKNRWMCEENSSTAKLGEHIPCGYSCQLYGFSIIQKVSLLYIVGKIA